MVATPDEIAADAAAFKAYVYKMLDSMGIVGKIAEGQIPVSAFTDGARAVVDAADASNNQSSAGRQAAGMMALRRALDQTGQGGRVNDQQCSAGAAAILWADYNYRKTKAGGSK